MTTLIQDLRYGIRMLAKNPGFTAVAVVALALGIGANTAVFSVVNAVLLRRLPYRDPGRLVWLTQDIKPLGAQLVGGPDYLGWHDSSQAFDGITAFGGVDSYNLTGQGAPERVQAVGVTADFFSVLGVQPARGRAIRPEEDRPHGNLVAVLTDGFWRRRFGADPGIVGQSLALNGESYTVVGIMPRTFRFPGEPHADLLTPLALDPVAEHAGGRMSIVRVIGRLKPGVTIAQAQEDLENVRRHASGFSGGPPLRGPSPSTGPAPVGAPVSVPGPRGPAPAGTQPAPAAGNVPFRAPAPQVPAGAAPPGAGSGVTVVVPMSQHPGGARPAFDIRVRVIPLQQKLVGDARIALLILLGAVAFVLLIACANVANLLLARATARSKEISIRAALGAGRWRIAVQLLTESLLLSLAGGALGLLLAIWGVSLIQALIPSSVAGDVFHQVEINIDGWVLAFTLGVSVICGILFGTAPAFSVSRLDLNKVLKETSFAAGDSPHRSRLRGALVVSELALALVLLVGAGLLVRSFFRILDVSPGFQPERVLTMSLTLPPTQYSTDAQRASFFKQLLERVQALPGVESAALTDSLPLTGFSNMTLGVQAEGSPPQPPGTGPVIGGVADTPDYFHTMGMQLMSGRPFNEVDAKNGGVVIINQSLARILWPNGDPVGKRMKGGPMGDNWATVIGVVADARHNGLNTEVQPEFHRPMFQGMVLDFAYLAVRAKGNPLSLSGAVRNEVGELDRQIPVYGVETMQERLSGSLSPERFNMVLLALFAALALALAGVGIYGVMSYSVTQRTHDIGVRMALGAAREDLLRLVVRQGMVLAAAGLGTGLVAALALTRVLSSLLYGIHATDPLTFAAVSLVLLAVAWIATYVPAHRATKVDPMVALRYE